MDNHQQTISTNDALALGEMLVNQIRTGNGKHGFSLGDDAAIFAVAADVSRQRVVDAVAAEAEEHDKRRRFSKVYSGAGAGGNGHSD